MADERHRTGLGTPLFAGIIIFVAATIGFSAFVPAFKCPACREWEPGYAPGFTHTGQCEFCDGEDRVTLINWFKARHWRSLAFYKV
jgi:hypothetical protein